MYVSILSVSQLLERGHCSSQSRLCEDPCHTDSGSGPSIFALSKSEETAKKAEKAMRKVYAKTDFQFETYVSKINTEGIKTL